MVESEWWEGFTIDGNVGMVMTAMSFTVPFPIDDENFNHI